VVSEERHGWALLRCFRAWTRTAIEQSMSVRAACLMAKPAGRTGLPLAGKHPTRPLSCTSIAAQVRRTSVEAAITVIMVEVPRFVGADRSVTAIADGGARLDDPRPPLAGLLMLPAVASKRGGACAALPSHRGDGPRVL
jgi:hypothetical protein